MPPVCPIKGRTGGIAFEPRIKRFFWEWGMGNWEWLKNLFAKLSPMSALKY